MNDRQKVEKLVELLKVNNNTVSVSDLLKATGSERRARRAVFMARKAGLKLEAPRAGGRGVASYTLLVPTTGAVTFSEALALLEPKRKPKAPTVAKQKVTKVTAPKKAKAVKAKKEVVDELAGIMTADDADEAPLGEA